MKDGAPLRVWSVWLHTKHVLAFARTSDLQESIGQHGSSPREARGTSYLGTVRLSRHAGKSATAGS